jgi:hypothetical protein
MPIINMKNLLKTIEKFYASPDNNKNIYIYLYDPINDYIILNIEKNSDFNQTVFSFLTQINLYLSKHIYIKKSGVESSKIIVNGFNAVKGALNTIDSYDLNKYAHVNNIINAQIKYL